MRQPAIEAPPVARPAAQPSPHGRDERYKWIAAAVVLVGAVMAIVDQTVVTVALPTLQKDFNVSLTDIQWVITAYTLALAAVIPMSGWLSDRYGAKRVFFTSQLLFTLGSIFCGLAWSHASLIGFRVLQGLGGGLIMPVGMAILMRISRPHERGRLMMVMGVPMLIGPVLGPTLGGWLVESASWRLIFYINVPIGIVGCLLTALQLREMRGPSASARIDLVGLALVTPAVVAMVYGLSQPSTYGWGSAQVMVPLLGGLAVLVVFCLYELRQKAPLIDIRVFHDAAFSAAMALSFLFGFALFAAMVLMPLFLQQVQGYGAFDAGLILGAQGVGAALVMPAAGLLTDRVGAAKIVPFGLVMLTASTMWFTTLAADTAAWLVVGMLAVRGVGMGFTMMPAMSSAYVTLRPEQIARATSVANVVQRVGSAFGIAVMATILSNRIQANLPSLPGGVSAASGAGIGGAHIPAALKSLLLTQVAKGYDQTFWVTVGLTLIAFPLALLLRRALKPEEVRTYAMNQLGEGIILGAAARRLRDGPLNGLTRQVDVDDAYRVLAASATSRLSTADVLLKTGTQASGLVPQKRLSPLRKAAIATLAVGAGIGFTLALTQAYRTPTVPALPAALAQAGQHPPGAPGGSPRSP